LLANFGDTTLVSRGGTLSSRVDFCRSPDAPDNIPGTGNVKADLS